MSAWGSLGLPLRPPLPPMEARPAAELPPGGPWLFEPKWDGFRCLAYRHGNVVALQSKSGQPLERYFPEVVERLLAVPASSFVLDGELVVPKGSFDDLLQRIHPAASRVTRLAAETPAVLRAFDLLLDERGRDLTRKPLAERRRALEAFARRRFRGAAGLELSPATGDAGQARRWLEGAAGVDGVMAKDPRQPYRSGERTAMLKIKRLRTADCVAGGFRYAARGKTLGSILLGLYDDAGLLHHVGFAASFDAAERRRLLELVLPLRGRGGFTGRAPGGPSRWASERSGEWEPLEPKLVVEVRYDHVTGGRFRHGTKLLRLRPDKAPRQCTLEQMERP